MIGWQRLDHFESILNDMCFETPERNEAKRYLPDSCILLGFSGFPNACTLDVYFVFFVIRANFTCTSCSSLCARFPCVLRVLLNDRTFHVYVYTSQCVHSPRVLRALLYVHAFHVYFVSFLMIALSTCTYILLNACTIHV